MLYEAGRIRSQYLRGTVYGSAHQSDQSVAFVDPGLERSACVAGS